MTSEAAMQRINLILAHAWMVRNFLKHADEVQEDEEMLEVHRVIYDYTRAVEPSFQRGDSAEYVRRAKGKLSKLRKVAEFFAENYARVSDHTNFQMAAISLRFVVKQIEEVLEEMPLHPLPEGEGSRKPSPPAPLPEGEGSDGGAGV